MSEGGHVLGNVGFRLMSIEFWFRDRTLRYDKAGQTGGRG